MKYQVVFTSDNPRSEDPLTIIEEMKAGLDAHHFKKYLIIMNYHLSIKVKDKIDLYRSLILNGINGVEGFLFGDFIGNIPIIDDILIIPFSKDSIDLIYPIILEANCTKLIGPIFIGKKNFESVWFTEDTVFEF